MGCEDPLLQGELSDIGHGVSGGSWFLRTFVVGPTGEAGESFFAQDLGDGGGAEVLLSQPLEFVSDVVDRVVLLAQYDHPRADSVLLGVGFGTVGDVTKEGAGHMMAEAVAEDAKGAGRIAASARGFTGGECFHQTS